MMNLALLIAAAILAPQDSADPYFQFKVGTTWTLEATTLPKTGPKVSKMEFKVVKEGAGVVDLETKATRNGKEPQPEQLRWSVVDGMLTWTEVHGGGETNPIRFYKVGSKKGDTWDWTFEGASVKGTNLGTEEVTVAAGTYKDALHVRCDIKDGETTFSMDLYLAPGVGPVKLSAGAGEKDRNVLELKEFKAGK